MSEEKNPRMLASKILRMVFSDKMEVLEERVKCLYLEIKNFFKNYFFEITIFYFLEMLLLAFFLPDKITLGFFITSFGAVFTALKYKLDRAAYHKSLFDERYQIFIKIEAVIRDCFNEDQGDGKQRNWRYLVSELDSVYRKSYFIFGYETYTFLTELRHAVINFSMLKNKLELSLEITERKLTEQKVSAAREFLEKLVDGQNLAKKFPELKIDSY